MENLIKLSKSYLDKNTKNIVEEDNIDGIILYQYFDMIEWSTKNAIYYEDEYYMIDSKISSYEVFYLFVKIQKIIGV